MNELLIHSMAEFSDVILGVLDLSGARTVVEIGVGISGAIGAAFAPEFSREIMGMTQTLAAFCARKRGRLIAIDPTPAPGFVDWAAAQPHVSHIARPSLDVVTALTGINAWVIDGDHNYYTVINELTAADALARRERTQLQAMLQHVGCPCARRDMYYAPGSIPAEYRQPRSHDAGVTLDDPGYRIDRGYRGAGKFAWALQAGGPENGVLTAIEDFCRRAESGSRRLLYAQIPAAFGLHVLFDADAPWAVAVAEALIPFHENPLLARLETNELHNYLTVLDISRARTENLTAKLAIERVSQSGAGRYRICET